MKNPIRVFALAVALLALSVEMAGAQSEGRKGRPRPRPAVAGFGQREAVDRIAAEIRDALKLRPTLVVWLVEQTSEAASLADGVADDIGRLMREIGSGDQNRLEMAVLTYGSDVKLLTPEPLRDAAQLQSALAAIKQAGGEQAPLFAACQQAIDKFLAYRGRGYEVMFVVVGASAGDDLNAADPAIAALKRQAVEVFGIGPAMPFGLPGSRGPQSSASASTKRRFESLSAERIQLALSGGQSTADLDDSGYGPFGLERICRQTGGRFFRLHETSPAGWEVDSATGDIKAELRSKYAPDYVNEQQYQRLLAENKCRLALHKAALLPPASGLDVPSTTIDKRKAKDEAALAKSVEGFQQAAALRDLPIQKLYDTLIVGEADRPKLTGARWQAAYDLAMGEALAAKARLDGYNAMLATLKQGKTFANADSTRWVLEPDESIPAGSALDKMAKNSRVYLQRVVAEHKGTPWAAIAERELRYPAGWKFVEQ